MSDDARSGKGRRRQPRGSGQDEPPSLPEVQQSGIQLIGTGAFDVWLRKLKDRRAAARIAERLERMEEGNLGDVKPLGDIWAIRFHFGPGYRIYCLKHLYLFVLLCGGDKNSQERDIKRAREMAKEIRDELRKDRP